MGTLTLRYKDFISAMSIISENGRLADGEFVMGEFNPYRKPSSIKLKPILLTYNKELKTGLMIQSGNRIPIKFSKGVVNNLSNGKMVAIFKLQSIQEFINHKKQ